jgi:hypothetical protein
VTDDTADHRDPEQWRFYVAPARSLPSAKSIGLGKVALLANPCPFNALSEAVARARERQ